MKKEKILKVILVLMVTVALLGISTNVFAATDGDTYLELPSLTNPDTSTGTTTTPDANIGTGTTTTTPDTNTGTGTTTGNQTNNYDTNLPETGIAENTVLAMSIIVLAGIAVFSYKKVNEYKNI